MMNISPIGRNCSRDERNAFEEYDNVHHIRERMIDEMSSKFKSLNLTYSIGGQISFDVFPVGWDKTYALQYIGHDEYDEIHFFGDKTFKGGNDYEIYSDSRTTGISYILRLLSTYPHVLQCPELLLPRSLSDFT
eukprot:535642_1